MDILKTLQAMRDSFGPSGDESGVAQVIEKLAKPYVDEITRDVMGNLICHKKGKGPKVMFAAHMDSLGCMVTYIEKEGYLRFGKVGGVYPKDVLATTVRFQNGVKGVVVLDEGVSPAKMTINDLAIDIGAKDDKEAAKMVKVGDVAVYDTPTYALCGRYVSPYMDNRSSCLVLLMALEKLGKKHYDNDLYFVFTVQEEVGLRGAKTAAYGIAPDYGVAVDVTPANDHLGTKHNTSSSLGGGAAIKVMDSSIICHPQMVKKLEEVAKKGKIKYQLDVIKSGGTDAGAIYTTMSGVLTGGISVPCRYIHSPAEMVDGADLESCADLVAAYSQAKL